MDEGTIRWNLTDAAESEVNNNSPTPFSVQIKVQVTKESFPLQYQVCCMFGGDFSPISNFGWINNRGEKNKAIQKTAKIRLT